MAINNGPVKVKWTHKIIHKDHNDYWLGALIDGKFYHNGLHAEHEKPRPHVDSAFAMGMGIEDFYNRPSYEVKKLNTFKGNK